MSETKDYHEKRLAELRSKVEELTPLALYPFLDTLGMCGVDRDTLNAYIDYTRELGVAQGYAWGRGDIQHDLRELLDIPHNY